MLVLLVLVLLAKLPPSPAADAAPPVRARRLRGPGRFGGVITGLLVTAPAKQAAGQTTWATGHWTVLIDFLIG